LKFCLEYHLIFLIICLVIWKRLNILQSVTSNIP
jgi:hypothetical protein